MPSAVSPPSLSECFQQYAKRDLWLVISEGAVLAVGSNPDLAKMGTPIRRRSEWDELVAQIEAAITLKKLMPTMPPVEFLRWCRGRVESAPELTEAVEAWHDPINVDLRAILTRLVHRILTHPS
jgi:hypothetical protein